MEWMEERFNWMQENGAPCHMGKGHRFDSQQDM